MEIFTFDTGRYQQPVNGSLLPVYRQPFIALLSFFFLLSGSLTAQCLLERGPGVIVAQDYDLNQGPYITDVDVYAGALNPSVTVTSNVTFTICFWGDMNNNNETFDVTIAGVTFSTGGFGSSTSVSNPACRLFTVSAANISTSLADGDIDVSYRNFGSGWTIPPVTDPPNPNPPGDEFNAQVQSFMIGFDIEPTIANPFGAFVCQNEGLLRFSGTPANGTAGGVGNFSITPASAALNTATGFFNPAAAEPGNYQVTYRFTYEGCVFTQSTTFEVVALPIATLENAVASCSSNGYSLTDLFTDTTLEGGTFSTTTTGATITGTNLSFSGGGCVDVDYTLGNPGGCTEAITTGSATIFFPADVTPNFLITSSTSCWDGTAPLAVEVNVTSPTYAVTPTYQWTETSTGINVNIGNDASATNPMITLEQAGASTLGTVSLCLTETITTSGTCSPDEDCTDLRCRSFTVTIAPCNEDCGLFSAPPAVCPLLTNPSFAFEIVGQVFAFGSPGAELFEASVAPSGIVGSEDAIISCTEPGLEVSWNFMLNENVFPASFDNPLSELVPPVAAYCGVANFGFNFPTGFCGNCGPQPSPSVCVDLAFVEPCLLIERIMPLSFLNFNVGGLGPICSITGQQLIVDPLQRLIQATAVSVVWADTDGDGAFDYVLEQGGLVFDGSGSGTAFVPNNVQGEGTITVRNLTASVLPPYSPCVAPEGLGLIQFLPIGAIPIVGPIIEEVFTTLGLDINIAPSANFDLPIRVVNDQEPTFLNFPSQYVFSQAGDCSTPINFSSPISVDACTGDIIEDVVQISGPASGDILQIPNPDSIGTDNPNTYEVTYRATACNDLTLEQTFRILISSNDPLLQCSGDVTIRNDVDACSKVVTGISPLQGAGCNNTITWTAPGATPAFGNDDASGTEFPVGVTTVTYTLTYADENGAIQTQTCNFDVTVEDAQAPAALCRDFEIQIGADGQAVVTVADINGGSFDNCPGALLIDLARPDMVFGPTVAFDCFDEGQQTVILRVTDVAANERRCLALVTVTDFFSDYELTLDVPELCIEANNPEQLNFSNYLVITDGEGNTTSSLDEMNDGDLIGGMFSISGFNSSIAGADAIVGTSVDEPGTVGYIHPVTGQYTPGTGTGFVEITYIIVIDGGVRPSATGIEGCYKMVTDVFELRQPLEMDEPECECIVQNDRVVDLGEITGGLEPYTIQYGGVKLDFDGDGISDEQDGEFVFEGTITGTSGTGLIVDITDFTQDLGNLLVDYTQPTWSFTIVDARGCELFRSGSCDNDDETGGPEIDCTALGAVTIYTRNEPACEVQDTWTHTLPTDNCDVILYTYTIENPDGTIAGPFDLTALLNPDITNPLADQFYGEYDFEHNSPTENVSTVTYYAEDAVGNFTQCNFTVTVIDDDAPYFINCPEPAVIVNAPGSLCAAFANYSLPLAADNCGTVVVTQVDDTGLTSGDLYPVGITINTFEAVDATGNTTRCDVKIIVNDFNTPSTIVCPADVVATNDEGDCGAIVANIAPSGITDNCLENLTVVYRIDDADGNELSSGLDDASGSFFGLGTSTITYSVQDMPLLLITEVTHEFSNPVDGAPVTAPTCFDGIQNGDETGIDCGGSSCVSCNCPADNEVTVEILLDGSPEQTAWTITEPNDGAVLATGGPYAPGTTTVLENICLPDGCYDFVITDTGLDGIAPGNYTVSTGTGVLASGGDFGVREVTNFCLDGTPTPASLTGTAASRDALEITNFGSANLDVSCLMIERVYAGGSETYSVPTGAILAPGGVLTIHFGDGHNDLANNIFNVPGATDLAITEPAAYILSLSRSILDVLVLNGFDISFLAPPAYNLRGLTVADYWSGTISPDNGGGVVRTTVWDTNTATDFAPGEACLPTTIGLLNPGLAQPTPNGASTAIQAQPTVRVECDFTVTITDDEDAVCGLYGEFNEYNSGAIVVAYGECIETVYTVGDAYTVSDVNLSIQGLAGDMGNLTFTLISPEGTEVVLAAEVCAGTDEVEFTFDGDFGLSIDVACGFLNNAGELVMPVGDIEIFNGEAAAGDWILQIGHNGQESLAPAAFASSTLFISSREAYPDYTVTLENDFRLCGADYTWNHAILFDNCPGGTILWTIVDSSGTTLESEVLPIFPENTEVTFFFPVGIATVTYTLTDGNGNVSSCAFDVTVNDTENPVITCPSDVTIQLAGGDCEEAYTPTDFTAEDNCAVVSIVGSPPFNQQLPIGINPVDFTVTDAAGNDTTCTYIVTILEYIPSNPQMACINQINVHIGSDCEQEIIPAMVLAGREYYCFDNYVLTLFQRNEEGTFDTITPNVVGIDQINQEVRYEVYDPRNDVSCWGNLNIGFYEAPEFICPADTTVSCNAATGTSLLGAPVLLSCALAGATVTHADTLQRNGACDDPRAILRRTWKVTDAFGNSGSCVQTISIEAFDLATVRFPADLDGVSADAINCAAAANDPSLTEPEKTGFPFVEDGSNIFGTNFCSASFLYTDEVYNICAGSYEILRTWKVRNTCQPVIPGVNPIEAVQIIRVLDFENPILECPDDVIVSTSGVDCSGAYLIPEPVVETGCTNFTYIVTVSDGLLTQLPGGEYLLSGLSEGTFTIQYEVEDECGRYSECRFNLTVEDRVGPTASCENGLNVSLDGNGQAIISSVDIDGSSADLCGEVTLAVRRLYEFDPTSCLPTDPFYSAWEDAIGVNCCDLQDLVTVELRVTDEDGNASVCWTEILIEDKLAPTCIAPSDVIITCMEYSSSLPDDINDATDEQLNAMFGNAAAADNCVVTISQQVIGDFDNCGTGEIVRTFTATDGSGLVNRIACTQTIEIISVYDYQITLPMDVSSTSCAEIPDFDDLVSTDLGCSLLTTTTQVDTLRTQLAGEECFKLRITYDIVNWCEYNSLGEPYLLPRNGRNGRNPETELMYLNVTTGPEVNVTTDDIAFLSRFSDRFFNATPPQSDQLLDDGNDNSSNDGNGVADQQAYASDDSRGAFRYVQYIKVYDEVAPVITVTEPAECFSGNGEGCTATVDLRFLAEDDCSAAFVTVELDANFEATAGFQVTRLLTATEVAIDVTGAYLIRLTGIPSGEHAVRIRATDGCGNADVAILEFCVSPDLAPAPICIQTLTVTLSDDGNGGGIADIWASDFVASPITDCFGNIIDTYSLYADQEAGQANFVPATDQQGVTLSCADLLGNATANFPVRLYAFDALGAFNYCQVIIEIQTGSNNPCENDGTAELAGLIRDAENNAIAGTTVNLTGVDDLSLDFVTTDEGTFSFANLPTGRDYTISPSHYEDYINGVRTSDIVAITRHILGVQQLDGPYNMLAGDVDGNTSVDVGDIISIRSLILGLTTVFPNQMPSWVFVPAGYEFSQPEYPWATAFPSVINHNDLVVSILDADFIGVKLGDVNQSARPNLQSTNSAPRSLNEGLELEVDERKMRRGETYRIPVRAPQLTEVDGYQFTLEFDRNLLDVTAIEPGLVAANNFGWTLADQGLITSSWNWVNNAPTDWTGDELLFTLVVNAKANASLSEGISLGSRYTPAEAYVSNSEVLRSLILVFNENGINAAANELFQNVPNPVRNQTVIGYRLTDAHAEVTVSIRDATGRLVREFTRAGTVGYNSLVIDNRVLGNTAGVYTYTVTAGNWVATKRMIVLK
jgi:hypothetical protein